MKMNEMYPSKYLAKEDVPVPRVVTIAQVHQEEIKTSNGNETRVVAYFHGDTKPMIVNKGNATTLCESFGDDSSFWHGKQIEVYTDPSVMFGGKRVGGLRLRVPGQNRPIASFIQAPFNQSLPAGPQKPQQLWDWSDGKTVVRGWTREQIQSHLNVNKMAANSIRLRPSNEPNTAVMPADELGFRDGADANDMIPF